MNEDSELTAKPSAKGLWLFMSYWRYSPGTAALSFFFSLVLALQSTVVPLLIALTLNQLVDKNVVNVGLMVLAGIIGVLILIGGFIADTYGVAELHAKVAYRLYADCFRYLIHQDYSFFANRFSGSIVTQASRFVKSYTFFSDTMFFNLLPQTFSGLIIVAVMMYYSWWLGLSVLIIWIVSMVLVVKFALNRLGLRRAAVAKESEQVGELADAIINSVNVKTFAAEDREFERYQKINGARSLLFVLSWRKAIRNGWIVSLFCEIMQMVVFIGGIIAVKHHTISIATFLLFQVYILRMIDNISRSGFTARQLEAVSGDAQEMAELFDQPPEVNDMDKALAYRIKDGLINFSDVSFQYADANNSKKLFDHFNLDIKPGERVGLVGPSGGGKTTITRLLLRFMDIQGGEIYIGGKEIREIKQKWLRQAIAYVPQEPLLFHRSIKDNIKYGRPDASDSEIIDVAKKAFAHDFIKDLPKGYNTLVGERGVKLSGGQRQRIAIARAMLTNAPLLILDEATSALDSESESLIQKALWELMKNKTAVVIAHRLSTIQRLDRIVVIDNGQVIEEGTHKQLLKAGGLYSRLWKHQSGGFIET